MSTVSMEPLLYRSVRESVRYAPISRTFKPSSWSCSTNHKLVFHARSFCNFRSSNVHALRASTTTDTDIFETLESTDVFFKETFPLKRKETVRILYPNISVSFRFVRVWFLFGFRYSVGKRERTSLVVEEMKVGSTYL